VSLTTPNPTPSLAERLLRRAAITALAVAALVVLASWLGHEFRPGDWLAWTLLKVWGWQAVLATSLVVSGYAILVRALGLRGLSPLHLLALSVPAGVVAFSMGLFAAGHLGLLNVEFAVVWPAIMITASAWLLRDDPDGALLVLLRRGLRIPSMSLLQIAVVASGCVGVGLVYLQILSPDSTTYDATWTHLAIAQDYAREGRIVPFYADWPRNLAHLGSVINTWSYLVPGLEPQAMKTMMALHTEFAFFVWTLVAVSAGIARLGAPSPVAWAALFLFPAFFYDDHCLGGGADHFLAFFSVPVFLGVLETARTLSWRWWAYLAIVTAGAVLTKYQAFVMVAPALAILCGAITIQAWSRRAQSKPIWGRHVWTGPALALGLSLVLTAPFFLENIVWYKNPIYPMAQSTFTASTPKLPDGALLAEYVQKNWGAHPKTEVLPWLRSLWTGISTFPCHPRTPESGPMFVFALVLTVLLPRARAIGFAMLFCLGCLVTWNSTYVQGRNLQGVLPIVAMATGAALLRGFRVGGAAKLAVGGLLAFQIAASFDAAFGDIGRIDRGLAMIRGHREGSSREWISRYRHPYVEITNELPRDAVVLLHSEHPSLGLDRATLHDWLGFQGLIDYRNFRNARDLYQRYKEVGITHVLYQPNSHPADTRQDDAIFGVFAMRCRGTFRDWGQFRTFSMPTAAPPDEPTYQVLTDGIPDQVDGLYPVTDLGTSEDLPHELQTRKAPSVRTEHGNASSLIEQARVLLLKRGSSIVRDFGDVLNRDFDVFGIYPDFSVYVRR
jgi:hypothetical protein